MKCRRLVNSLLLGLLAVSAGWPAQAGPAAPDVSPDRPSSQSPTLRPARMVLEGARVGHQELVSLPLGAQGWVTVLREGFEGTFPGTTWKTSGNPTWGRETYRSHGGSAGAYCTRGGSAAVDPPGPYPPNMNAWMSSGPFDFSTCTEAELYFYYWTKSQSDKDITFAGASTDGSNFVGYYWDGDEASRCDGWCSGAFDLTKMGDLGNLCGKPRVWIAFVFQSDATTSGEGSYLDDIWLRLQTAAECPGAAETVYFAGRDNENNEHTGSPDNDVFSGNTECLFNANPVTPIEFNVDIPSLSSFSSAQLSLYAWDVDEQGKQGYLPEVDEVLVNGHLVGTLTGWNNVWSTSVFNLNPSWVSQGHNLVEVRINKHYPNSPDTWCTSIDWGQIVLDHGNGAASIRSAASDKGCYIPGEITHITVEVDTSLSQQEVRVEASIIDPGNSTVASADRTLVTRGSQNDSFTVPLSLPTAAVPGVYRQQLIVYDTCSDTQNAIWTDDFIVDPAGCAPTPTATPSRTPTHTATPSPTPSSSPTGTATTASFPRYMPLLVRAS